MLPGVGESDWSFKNTTEVSAKELAAPNIDLVFDGLDTFASVELVRFIIQVQIQALKYTLGIEWIQNLGVSAHLVYMSLVY